MLKIIYSTVGITALFISWEMIFMFNMYTCVLMVTSSRGRIQFDRDDFTRMCSKKKEGAFLLENLRDYAQRKRF